MEKKIDIIPFLEGIVEENTHHYQSDFDYDKARLTAAMLEVSQENRTFLWMSRPCGTYCVLEREAFIEESPAHVVWTNTDYVRQANQIKAYRVIVAPGIPALLCWASSSRSIMGNRYSALCGTPSTRRP